ncbi:putative bZIP transcription factor [Talaromyces proteolyticus]|uniref:BZIP transcription factor n=1 Tax=Talaromyces proteolyticus TaxID=1131652 RepID=A0AAD4KSP2_9EURO|nr:putative bZIP transcription factor [Talaromyces proteolyticus]KAH8698506.1 putative bZIP transcription factor [Talaromyces proteolyticus]
MDAPGDDDSGLHGGDFSSRSSASAFSFVVPLAAGNSSVNPDPNIASSPAASMPGGADAGDGGGFDDAATSHAGRKRKAASNSTLRGVANLTPEQLARKRANDRQAQRAIRERTKAQIEALEQRVRDLSSQQPYQDLQKLVAEKDTILAENEDIRRRLSTVMGILHPLLDRAGSGNKSANVSPAQVEATHPSPFTDRSHDTPISVESVPLDPSDSTPESAYANHGVVRGWQRLDPTSFVNPAPAPRQPNKMLGEKLILNFLVDNPNQIPKIDDIHKFSEALQVSDQPPSIDLSTSSDQPLAYMIPVRNVPPTCALDTIFLDFLHDRRRDLSDGSRQRLAYPSVSSLLNPAEDSPYSYSISKVFSDILRAFPDISSLPEQVGTLYIMFQLMRWQMDPTQQNYDRMPDWLTPRPAQLFTPHPAWVDYLLWPQVRDRLVYNYRNYPFENWFGPYTRTISCNWPYEATDCLLHNTDSDELLINPVFERHVRNLRNWTLGTEFAEAYPGLVDVINIKPERRN